MFFAHYPPFPFSEKPEEHEEPAEEDWLPVRIMRYFLAQFFLGFVVAMYNRGQTREEKK